MSEQQEQFIVDGDGTLRVPCGTRIVTDHSKCEHAGYEPKSGGTLMGSFANLEYNADELDASDASFYSGK